jgi:hypothetical protein
LSPRGEHGYPKADPGSCSRVKPAIESLGGTREECSRTRSGSKQISALEAYPSQDYGYAAAKAAQLAYMKKLAMHCASRQVRVNALAPGSIEFPGGVWAFARENQPEMYAAALASIPSGRLGPFLECGGRGSPVSYQGSWRRRFGSPRSGARTLGSRETPAYLNGSVSNCRRQNLQATDPCIRAASPVGPAPRRAKAASPGALIRHQGSLCRRTPKIRNSHLCLLLSSS